ncbi:MAG: class I SAM-dependent methyltransferase, partial [Nevskiales bacterium]
MQCPVCESRETRHFERIENRVYWRCNRCEATFLDPAQRPSAEEEQAQYRLHNNEINDAGYRQFLARLAEPLLQRLQPGSKGLDYGCGPGPALADMLSKAGHCMTLYDPLFFPETTALQSRYDFITCTEVVEHFHQPAQEFRRLDQ